MNIGTKRPLDIADMYPTINIADLTAKINNNTLPHNMIFAGNPGLGKTTLARLVAADILKLEGEERKLLVSNGIYNDIEYIEINAAGKGKVDDARNLGEEIAKCSLYESEKPFIFVLDEAQRYTASAKQSLLTALDDYQKNVYIIVLTSDLASFLDKEHLGDAVDRRFQTIFFYQLTKENSIKFIDSVIKREGYKTLPIDIKRAIAEKSNYSPGVILKYLQNYYIDPNSVTSEKEEETRAKDIFTLAKKASKAVDAAPVIKELIERLDSMKEYIESWEKVRISLLAFVFYSLSKAENIDTKSIIRHKTILSILKNPLLESSLGKYDLTQRLLEIILILKEYS